MERRGGGGCSNVGLMWRVWEKGQMMWNMKLQQDEMKSTWSCGTKSLTDSEQTVFLHLRPVWLFKQVVIYRITRKYFKGFASHLVERHLNSSCANSGSTYKQYTLQTHVFEGRLASCKPRPDPGSHVGPGLNNILSNRSQAESCCIAADRPQPFPGSLSLDIFT